MFDESCLGPFDGLRAICYIMTILYFANFNQKDLLLRNRWKEVEKASTDKSSWVVVAQIWAYLDLLFFYSAFLQSNKIFKYFTWIDIQYENEKRVPSKDGQNQVSRLKKFQTRQKSFNCLKGQSKWIRGILEIYLMRVIRLLPALIITFILFNSLIFYLGSGPTWG